MQLPGLLIEYLISGAFALLWILVLLVTPGVEIPMPRSSKLWPLLVPLLYVLGMLIDYIASIAVYPLKQRIKRRVRILSNHDTTKLWIKSPDLAREIAHRSSRDRVARGAIINIFFLTTILVNYYMQKANFFSAVLAAGIGTMIFAISVLMWYRFQQLTIEYEKKALKASSRFSL